MALVVPATRRFEEQMQAGIRAPIPPEMGMDALRLWMIAFRTIASPTAPVRAPSATPSGTHQFWYNGESGRSLAIS